MDSSEKPLRILAVLNLPWDPRLGASRVWIELAAQWQADGHTVDYYSLTEAFPQPSESSAVNAFRQSWFAYRARRYIRQNGAGYHVIDSLLGTLPFSKVQLRFRGLLVARSIGFYSLYEAFDREARQRWPQRSRGKLAGRVLHTSTKRRWLRASGESIRQADLINLPNEDELVALRRGPGSARPAMVQPYGLTLARASALARAADSTEARLAGKIVSFIGMWSVRKGSQDWREIMCRIREAVPATRFRMLGTLAAEENIIGDLGSDARDYCELIREYDPDELPALLANSAVGLFPSYVEGFGLGLLEQLASGIPTVAYDVPGPRQILRPIPSLLVQAGDVERVAARVCELLRASADEYETLREQSFAVAKKYSWPEIARATIRSYREALRSQRGPILFTQPFGMRSPGGGARIMRALLDASPVPIAAVCTSPVPPPTGSFVREMHVRLRPNFGRIETTRFSGFAHATAPVFAKRFQRRLEDLCISEEACAIHSIAHGGLDFYYAFLIARKLGLPFFLQVHDDLPYTAQAHRHATGVSEALGAAWRGARRRFVIGAQLGEEYCRRYGSAAYTVVTDGLEQVAAQPVPRPRGRLRIYFMGLFHLEYEPNLSALFNALDRVRAEIPAGEHSITLRCGGVRQPLLRQSRTPMRVLPFGSEADVKADLETADLLYLPLPFDDAHDAFVRFSLSTKLITYIGSGIPILYHGPENAAVFHLLRDAKAALLTTTLDSATIAATLRHYAEHEDEGTCVAENALRLARSEFMLGTIRERFWDSIQGSLAT
ncbi:MAG: glycosyltransferase [Chthoniobacterales bacterium]